VEKTGYLKGTDKCLKQNPTGMVSIKSTVLPFVLPTLSGALQGVFKKQRRLCHDCRTSVAGFADDLEKHLAEI
jgi:hypothetical protein